MRDLGVGLGLGGHPLLGKRLGLGRDHLRRRHLTPRDPPEVAARQIHGLVGLKVADQHRGEIVGGVVGGHVALGLRPGHRLDVGGPADDRVRVGGGLPEHGVERLLLLAGRRGLDGQAPLLPDHVALGVELAHHGVRQAVRLHPEPQLQLVGGQGDEVEGLVLAGSGVEARGALLGVDLVQLVLDDDVLLGRDELLVLLLELLQSRRGVGGVEDGAGDLTASQLDAQLGVLLLHLGPHLVLLLDDGLVAGPVGGADRPGALEHHVLEDVREPGDALGLVDRPHLGHEAAAHGRRIVTFHQQEAHAVGQHLLAHLHLLGAGHHRYEKRWQDGSKESSLHTAPFHPDTESSTPAPRGQSRQRGSSRFAARSSQSPPPSHAIGARTPRNLVPDLNLLAQRKLDTPGTAPNTQGEAQDTTMLPATLAACSTTRERR